MATPSDPYTGNQWVGGGRAQCVSQDKISHAAVTNGTKKISVAVKNKGWFPTHAACPGQLTVAQLHATFPPGPRLMGQPLLRHCQGNENKTNHVLTLEASARR